MTVNRKYPNLIILLLFAIVLSLPACKAKECPAFQEANMTGGSIDKNKKSKRKKSKGGVFNKKTMKRYNR